MAEQRLIDANELIKFIRKLSPSPFNEWDTQGVLNAVDWQPTVDAKPVVHGRWIDAGEEDGEGSGNFRFCCSNCSASDVHSKAVDVNFCWRCGADMRGGENG